MCRVMPLGDLARSVDGYYGTEGRPLYAMQHADEIARFICPV